MKKTYLGQTAGGILKTARVCKMAMGDKAIFVKTRDGRNYMARLGSRIGFAGGTIRDVMLLWDDSGIVAALETSSAAYQKMCRLEREAY